MTSFTTSTLNYPQLANTPLRRVKAHRAPTTSDNKNFILGDEWLDLSVTPFQWWKLLNATATVGTWSRITGGSAGPIAQFDVDASTPPGVDPVVPDNTGLITITGGQIAANSTANVIRTNSTAVNTLIIEVQQAGMAAVTTPTLNGVSHFNSAQFTVDSSGFVSITGSSAGAVTQVNPDTGTNIVPTAGVIKLQSASVVAGTTPIQTKGTAADTITIQVQETQAIAASDVTKTGLATFNSAQFTVTGHGFVSLISGALPAFQKVIRQVFTTPGANTYTPTANMVYCDIEVLGGGGGGGGAAAASPNLVAIGGGGGAGGYARKVVAASVIGVSQVATVGAAGAAGAAGNNNGGAGGTSSLGAIVTASGGSGGGGGGTGLGVKTIGGVGGIGTSGDFNTSGAPGGWGAAIFSAGIDTSGASGIGASSLYGGGGNAVSVGNPQTLNGNDATNYGSGGSGGAVDNNAVAAAGGAGSKGIVIITEYIA